MNEILREKFAQIQADATRVVGLITPEKLIETVVRKCLSTAESFDLISQVEKVGSLPAFPVPPFVHSDGSTEWGFNGQSNRQHVATACLQGLLASPEFYATLTNNHPETAHEIAALEAVKFADALLIRLAK